MASPLGILTFQKAIRGGVRPNLFAVSHNFPVGVGGLTAPNIACLLYTSPSPRDVEESRMPSSA